MKQNELKCWNIPNILEANKEANRKDKTNFLNVPTLQRELPKQTTHINGSGETMVETGFAI